MDSARLTITDIIYILVALAAIAAMWPTFTFVLSLVSDRLSQGEELLFTTMLPVAVLVLLAIIYIEARSGA